MRMSSIKFKLLVVLLCCLLTAAGCGQSATEAPDGTVSVPDANSVKGLIEPSSLLTKVEVEAALGEPVEEPESKDTGNPTGQKICLFSTVSSDRLVQISIVQTGGMTQTLKQQGYSASKLYQETKEMLDPVQPVTGLGDDAFWGTNGLHILKGDVYLNLSVGNTSRPENLELAKGLAQKALTRI